MESYFKMLFNAKVQDRVKFEEKTGTLRDIILSIKLNKAPLFVGVEQGAGSNEDNILLLMTPSLR